ncbi:MAG: hypothetical protein IJK08_12330 [Prevotella sp.]|nr:hypothetical protein [Prevotella sp.]
MDNKSNIGQRGENGEKIVQKWVSRPSSGPIFLVFLHFGRKRQIIQAIMEEFINRDKRFPSYLCIDIKPKSMNEMTDKQRAARKLASDYSRYLFDQENLVERIMERKWQELSSYIEDLIDKKMQERMTNEHH